MNTAIQKYLKKKLSSTIHNVLKDWGTEWAYITELDKLNDFKGEIIGRLFEKYLNYCKSYNQTTNPCSAKEVIKAIEVKKTIKAKREDNIYSLSFPNYTYEIEDSEHKFRIRPLSGKSERN